ncbi:hypothetical protein HDU91_001671 [Kappamyces sp. JEL0680]|nr:hypothetical protein HDU91_001671 [Kappamyces sp. JEL0680]
MQVLVTCSPLFSPVVFHGMRPEATVGAIRAELEQRLALFQGKAFYFTSSGRRTVADEDRLEELAPGDGFPVCLAVQVPVLGGKGGFGSLLRQEGKRKSSKKTTNFESSRDLSGRRLKTVNDAKKLADYIAQTDERKRKERANLEEKIQDQMKKMQTKEIRADHSQFLKEKEKALETMDDAITQG